MRPLHLAVAISSVITSSCVVGSPPGFGSGDVWTIPLIAPLEDGVLLVPVSINETGPYLFLIDPDSRTSTIDAQIVHKLDLYTRPGAEETTEGDFKVPTFYAEIPKMKAGNLVVSNHRWRINKPGTYMVGGRPVLGVLGGDIIADSLVFQVDRDAGVVTLAEQGKISPPPGSTQVSFSHFYRRRLTKVSINNNKTYKMHIDLGGRLTRLWKGKLSEAKLPKIAVRAKLVDEYGAVQSISTAGMAAQVSLEGEDVQGIMIVPFGDKRLDEEDIDGALGQDFLSRFHITANWHKKTMWLQRREENLEASATKRLNRWSTLLTGCSTPGCVKVSLSESSAPGDFVPPASASNSASHSAKGAAEPTELAAEEAPGQASESKLARPDSSSVSSPDSPSVSSPAMVATKPVSPIQLAPRFRVELDPAASPMAKEQQLEVLLDAVDKNGKSMGLPKVIVTLSPGSNLVEGQLDTSYAGINQLAVLDVSPFGRPCHAGRCYWIQSKSF